VKSLPEVVINISQSVAHGMTVQKTMWTFAHMIIRRFVNRLCSTIHHAWNDKCVCSTGSRSLSASEMTCIVSSGGVKLYSLTRLKQQVDVWPSRRLQNDTRRVVLDSLELLNGAGWSVVQHRVAVVDSRENQLGCMQESVLSLASVGGVCGKSHMHGKCTIALRLVWRVVIENQATIESDAENSHRVRHRQVDTRDWY